jgi:hypothetical protein
MAVLDALGGPGSLLTSLLATSLPGAFVGLLLACSPAVAALPGRSIGGAVTGAVLGLAGALLTAVSGWSALLWVAAWFVADALGARRSQRRLQHHFQRELLGVLGALRDADERRHGEALKMLDELRRMDERLLEASIAAHRLLTEASDRNQAASPRSYDGTYGGIGYVEQPDGSVAAWIHDMRVWPSKEEFQTWVRQPRRQEH